MVAINQAGSLRRAIDLGRHVQGDRLDFDAINKSALAVLPSLCRRWCPQGALRGSEWVALNPTRMDSKPGSFSVNVRTGKWGDFATGEVGGDVIGLAAYLFHSGNRVAAARDLRKMFGS